MPKPTPEMRNYLERQAIKRQLWCATIAVEAFRNVRRTAYQYAELGCNDEHPLHYPLMSSIVVTYAKVFGSSRKGTELPKRFTQLADPDLKVTHDALLLFRNNIYAHSDATFEHYKLSVRAYREDTQLKLELRAEGPHLKDIGIPYIIRLCDIQLANIAPYRQSLVLKLLPTEDVSATLDVLQTDSVVIPIEWPKPLDPNLTEPPNTW